MKKKINNKIKGKIKMNQELKKYEQNISQAWQFNKIAKKVSTHFLF